MRLVFLITATLLLSCPAMAVDLPIKKAGLWEIKSFHGKGQPPQVLTQCIDDAYEKEMLSKGKQMAEKNCSEHDTKKEGDKYVTESICDFANHKMTTRAVTTGDFETTYTTTMENTYEPPLQGSSEGSMKVTGTYLGPCEAGQKPGDIMTSDGSVINSRRKS